MANYYTGTVHKNDVIEIIDEYIVAAKTIDNQDAVDMFDDMKDDIKNVKSVSLTSKVVAEVKVDTDDLVRRIKEEVFDKLLEGQWNECSRKLPAFDATYLVTKRVYGWNCAVYYETDVARYEKKNGWQKENVVAWMEKPLPWGC